MGINYYKFIIYTPGILIEKALPSLKTKTSPVYDYEIGMTNTVAPYHACFPIWYGQNMDIVDKVIQELNVL